MHFDSRCSCYSAFTDCNALLLLLGLQQPLLPALDALASQHFLTCHALLLSLGLQHPLLPTLDALAIQHLLTCNALLLSLGLQHPLLPTLATQLRLAMLSTCN